jgi:hypothetical protein
MNTLKSIVLTAFCSGIFLQLQAQSLYMPRDIKQAYAKGTRSPDGKPGS